jgi:hypothetical protein
MWIGANVTRPARIQRTVASMKRMFWIDSSRPGIGAVVMLFGGRTLNKDFFAGTVPPNIVDERTLSRPKLKASGTFLQIDKTRPLLTSDKQNKFRIKRLPHPP